MKTQIFDQRHIEFVFDDNDEQRTMPGGHPIVAATLAVTDTPKSKTRELVVLIHYRDKRHLNIGADFREVSYADAPAWLLELAEEHVPPLPAGFRVKR